MKTNEKIDLTYYGYDTITLGTGSNTVFIWNIEKGRFIEHKFATEGALALTEWLIRNGYCIIETSMDRIVNEILNKEWYQIKLEANIPYNNVKSNLKL